MVHLQWEKKFVVKMGKKRIMLPVEEVDISAVKYENEVIKGYDLFLGRFWGFSQCYLLFTSEFIEVDSGFWFDSSTFDWVLVEVVC